MAEPEDEPPVEIEIGDALDLHSFAPRDVTAVVAAYLDAAAERGLREVRLIHGKGRGVQRASVRRVLAHHPRVLEFWDGTPERGAWGATIVRLRP
jgi:DNA-nicking Smr family endonuclease